VLMPLMMPDSTGPALSTVKRACDCCHKRKVKCIGDGTRPCKNCTAAGLTCTYNAIPQKKGPKGSRAKVISELRETQRQSQLAARARHGLGFEASQYANAFSRTPDLLSMELITSCVDYFFANMYPTQPILHRQKVGETIGKMENSVEAYCLVVSLCSYMLIQPNTKLPAGIVPDAEAPNAHLNLGMTLLDEAIRVRKGYDYIESPGIWSVITSFFFFGAHFCLDKHNTAWFHLREATTLAQIMGMQDENHYSQSDLIETSRRRRLYWLLFITERAYAIQRHRPLTLHATINLPTLNDDPAETVELSGFIHLVTLFKPFDDTFVGLWNKARVGCSTEWLARLQNQLAEALPAYLHSTESQAVDLRTSQQWLRTMVWQLSISHGYLSSAAADSTMSFKYPIEISRDLIAATSGFSQAAMEVHGIGLVEKLFDVACTLTDVMSCVPFEQHTFEYGPRDYLNQFLSLISTLRGGQQRYLPLLLSKINDTLPQMPTPGFSMVSMPTGRGRIDEIYDSSNPASGDSTPFGGSPPPQPVGPQLFQSAYPDDFKLPGPTSNGFPMMTSAPSYNGIQTPAQLQAAYQSSRNAYSGLGGQSGFDHNP
ncbi:unnamed protein product, partial [Aureobasidium uvarum]